MKAYIDDYRLIRVYGFNDCGFLVVKSNDQEKEYDLIKKDEYVELHLKDSFNLLEDNYLLFNEERINLEYRFIFHSERFDQENIPDLSTLGCFYQKDKTIFRIWAPFKKSVKLVLDNQKYEMSLCEKWVYEYIVYGDLEYKKYHYEIVSDETVEVFDPFSYSRDGLDSFVLDLNKLENKKEIVENKEEPIIYELSVRDFSSAYPFENQKKLKALVEPKSLDYLKDLGITHIQLMPILDYDDDHSDYNWGYNPISYAHIKPSYLCDLSAYGQITEVQDVFNTLHENGLKVVLDVVFNHVYEPETFVLNRLLPYYFYRYKDLKRANGTGLGNELRTESRFFREYLIEMCLRLVKLYDIDGLRFDLAGIIDLDTMHQLKEKIALIKNDFLYIAEGWNMGETLNPDLRYCLENAKEFKESLYFNAFFKDTVKEYGLGKQSQREAIKKVFLASKNYLDKNQSLNYIECHDDYTYYDYLKVNGLDESLLKERCKFGLAFVLLSKGIPFIHSGQEFLRSKKGHDNTYNQTDEINKFDWKLCQDNYDVVEYTKELIKLRRLLNINALKNGKFRDYYELLIYETEDLVFFINPCPYTHIYTDEDYIYNIIFDGHKLCQNFRTEFKVEPYTFVLARKKR